MRISFDVFQVNISFQQGALRGVLFNQIRMPCILGMKLPVQEGQHRDPCFQVCPYDQMLLFRDHGRHLVVSIRLVYRRSILSLLITYFSDK